MPRNRSRRPRTSPPPAAVAQPPAAPAAPAAHGNWPLPAALALLGVSFGVILAESLSYNQGHLAYSLDDAYIHMALAKHLVQHGVWGVTPYGFSSSQSSLLWPLLLAAVYLVAGPNTWTPLVLNIVIAAGLVSYLFLRLKRFGVSPAFNLLILAELIVFTPLPWMMLDGMEHILQSLVSLALAYLCVRAVGQPPHRSALLPMLLLAPVVTAVRYEGLFVVAALTALFWLRGRWLPGLALLAVGAVPPLIYGLISSAHGGYWVPNSALMKANAFAPSLLPAFGRLPYSRSLVLVVPAALLYLYRLARRHGFWNRQQLTLLVFVVVFMLQASLARVDYPRYEAYLVTLGLYALAVSVVGLLRTTRMTGRAQAGAALAAMAVLWVLPPGLDGMRNLAMAPLASSNIYQQQYQMGRFLGRYYQGEAVAANDIGAIDYLADLRLFDLAGLGTTEVIVAARARAYGPARMAEMARARKVKIAVAYEDWFRQVGGLPPDWVLVGTWRIPFKYVLGSDTVSFYAVMPSEAPRLRQHLQDFASQLPPQVRQTVYVGP